VVRRAEPEPRARGLAAEVEAHPRPAADGEVGPKPAAVARGGRKGRRAKEWATVGMGERKEIPRFECL
jgi:hypothetical protein